MCEEKWGQDVHRVLPGEVLGFDRTLGVIEVAILGDTGVVDQNVNLKFAISRELLFRSGENRRDALGGIA